MEQHVELQQLVKYVAGNLTAAACSRNSFFVNDVAPGIIIHADREMLAETLGKLLAKAIEQTGNNCIRIEAVVFNQIVSLVINQTGQCSSAGLAVSMEPLQPVAEKLGGSISVVSDHEHKTLVALSFFNGRRAA